MHDVAAQFIWDPNNGKLGKHNAKRPQNEQTEQKWI